MDALLVVDMQEGILGGDAKHARLVIEHHNWIWANLFAPEPVSVVSASDIQATCAAR